MALRLRRGTDAERQLITPAEGELIYTTDTKSVYIGDGTTVGGIIISGEIGLGDLAEVDLSTPPTEGQILVWDGTQFVPDDLAAAGSGVVEGSNYRINITADDSTVIVDTATSTFTGNFVGDGSGLTNLNFSDTVSIFNLSDVFAFTPPDPNDVLIFDGINFTPQKIRRIEGFDSTIILDAETNSLRGELTGDVFGNVTGNLIGNVTGNVIGNVTGNVTGNLNGVVSGVLIGDHTGSVFSDDSALIIDGLSTSVYTASVATERIYSEVNAGIIEIGNDSFGNYYDNTVRINKTTGVAFSINSISNDNNAADIRGVKSRGTFETPASIQSGDRLLEFSAAAFDGTDIRESGVMTFLADAATPVGSLLPGKFRLRVVNTAGSVNEISLDSAGVFTMSDIAKLNVLTAPPGSPAEGMIAIADQVNWDPASKGSGGSYPVYYNGTSWASMT